MSASADKTTSTEEPVDSPQEADQRKGAYQPGGAHERPSVTVDVVILTVSERRLEVF